VRLEIIGSAIILGAAGFSIIAVASGTNLSAGMVGLSMSYALQVSFKLLHAVLLAKNHGDHNVTDHFLLLPYHEDNSITQLDGPPNSRG